MLFLSVNDTIPRDKIFGLCEALNHSSISDKAVLCLGEKQGIIILNNERRSWYNRVGDF